jgi:hypothetical protein
LIHAITLRANDSIQKKIEQGLRQYGIHYRRKRGYKRASKTDIRMEMAAEVILATKCHRPNEARYCKGLHFEKIYFQILEFLVVSGNPRSEIPPVGNLTDNINRATGTSTAVRHQCQPGFKPKLLIL